MVTVPLWLPPRHPPGLSQAPSSATHGYPSSFSPLLYLTLRSDQDPQQQLLFGRGSSSAHLGLESPSMVGPAVPRQLLEGKPWQGEVALSPKGVLGGTVVPTGCCGCNWDAPVPGAEVL